MLNFTFAEIRLMIYIIYSYIRKWQKRCSIASRMLHFYCHYGIRNIMYNTIYSYIRKWQKRCSIASRMLHFYCHYGIRNIMYITIWFHANENISSIIKISQHKKKYHVYSHAENYQYSYNMLHFHCSYIANSVHVIFAHVIFAPGYCDIMICYISIVATSQIQCM